MFSLFLLATDMGQPNELLEVMGMVVVVMAMVVNNWS
jgi:hypothetical protein